MRPLLILFLVLLIPSELAARDLAGEVPDLLTPWIPWVLDGKDERACPGPAAGGERLCAWPGRLHLDLDAEGGTFAQHWTLYAAGWVPLPGGAEHWPQEVRVGEVPAAVVERDGVPAVRLEAGEHPISGRFVWTRLPEGLALPPASVLVELRLGGETRPFPRLSREGRLWLGTVGAGQADAAGDALGLTVSRRVEDDIPLRVVTRLELDVSGNAQELALGPVLLAGGIPLGLSSPLPARLEPDGRLRLQVRPGRWTVEVRAHHPGPVGELALPTLEPPWPREEVWVFAAHPQLRQVEVTGAEPVDPRQTRLPGDWMGLPAYLLHPGEALRLVEIARGDATPAPDRLTLERDLWLDFDGGGYTLRDLVTGRLSRSWRLEVDEPLRLGRVEEGGEPRFITRLTDGGRAGVEVRRAELRLVAESRIEGGERRLPASGWTSDLERLQTRLHLPPGWELLAVSGVDNLPETWINAWSLLDLFLVLLIGIGAARLWGLPWGLLALATVVLTWHEPGAPRLVWLNLLAAVALLRVLPEVPERAAMARLRRLLALYYRGSLVVLALIALPFLVDQARTAIFPQLEGRGLVLDVGGVGMAPPPTARPAPAGESLRSKVLAEREASPAAAVPPLPRIDPDAKIQTGPGVPDWTWSRYALAWNGPVPRDHRVELWLLSPAWNLVLAVLRLVLVLVLALKAAGLVRALLARAPAAAAVLLAAGIGGSPGPAQAADFPSPELLGELRERLLQPPECLPACADIPLMGLATAGETLHLLLTINVAEAAAVPIPGAVESWVPTRISRDGEALDSLRRAQDGTLLLPLPAGSWRIGLSGPLPPRVQVELPLPLRPHRVLVSGAAFEVQGLDEQGRPGAQIQLVRREQPGAAEGLEPAEVPPLLLVRRTLRLGLEWAVETRVSRLSPLAYPAAVEVPLIPGEQVLKEGARVSDGRLLVSLAPGQAQARWTSALEPVETIRLRAADDPRLAEEWRVEVGSLWHLQSEGIPVVHHQGSLERWRPTWRPWPGEEVLLRLSRPAGVAGPTLSLIRSEYRLAPGQRAAQASLGLTLRSSQGDRHRIRLPEAAELVRVRIDGVERPLRLEGRDLILPLVPATQQVEVEWRQPDPVALYYRPPLPDVGLPGVNANLAMALSPDRWILLTGGPVLGPAVLFWGLVVVLVLIALGLGRSRVTPLGFWDWLLLGLGLSQAGIWTAVLVAGWLLALGLRARLARELPPWRFNLMQIGLVLLSLLALSALVGAVQQGLLGQPDMQIAGNGSHAGSLDWYQDRTGPALPEIWVVSVPILVYRVLMLAWALWLAFRVIAWLRWGWQELSSPVLWRELKLHLPGPRPRPKADQPS